MCCMATTDPYVMDMGPFETVAALQGLSPGHRLWPVLLSTGIASNLTDPWLKVLTSHSLTGGVERYVWVVNHIDVSHVNSAVKVNYTATRNGIELWKIC